MNKLLRKVLVIVTLMLNGLTPSQSADFFSYSVLRLPAAPEINKPWVKFISNQSEWEAYFYATTAAITYPQSMAPVAPVLDFERYQLISGGLGVRPTGGYYLAIESVFELENAMFIHVLDVRPGSACVVSFAFTNPSITFLVKKTDKPIKFTVSKLINQCAD